MFLGMWIVMMVAMMMPWWFSALWPHRRAGWLTALMGTGYLFVRTVVGLAAFPVGAALASLQMRHDAVSRATPLAGGIVVLAAGLLQFTAGKSRRLACCRQSLRPGDRPANAGAAWRHGVGIGLDSASPDEAEACRIHYNPIRAMDTRLRQRVRYLRTEDGVELAWADMGTGPVVVKAANWLSHLEYELESPVWGHWFRFFGEHFRFLRWDERGCGLTDRDVEHLSFEHWIRDIEDVVGASGIEEAFTLLGISSGAATSIAYAARHPERVARLILYGGYARGWARRGDSAGERQYRAILELIRLGWGKENPVFRQVFTSRFLPAASEAQIGWYNELCRRTSTGEMAARLLENRSTIDATDLLGSIRAPTLVIHSRDDEVCPIAEARHIAAGIPGAQFVELDSRNHILLEDEPAWARFQEAVLDFTGVPAVPAAGEEDAAFAGLTSREREVLALITQGLANADIGERLAISEKTVRNHVSNLFDKLGVWTRAQAMVFARDRGFRPERID